MECESIVGSHWSPSDSSDPAVPLTGIHDVADDTSTDLQNLIDRLRRGDEQARHELLQRAHDRSLRIAAKLFQEDFPALHGRHDLESVLSELWIRLVQALEATQPETVDGFFGLVFQKVRQVLLDMAMRQRQGDARIQEGPIDPGEPVALANYDQPDTTFDPDRLALLTEFHQQVELLPVDERRVFELCYYGGYSQVEVALMLDLHKKQVSRLWLAATGRLARWLDGSAALI
jgi:RNA polymerase sigma factor (sigma-70 family)